MRTMAASGCITTAFLLGAAPASAMIQVDHGIAGARLGASRSAVQAALGKPSKTVSGSNDFGPFVRYTYSGGLRVLFQGGRRVSSVTLTGHGDRTTSDVGVGSSEAQVKAGVKGVKCETTAGTRSCHTGTFTPGKVVTDFQITAGKVSSVTVGRVVD